MSTSALSARALLTIQEARIYAWRDENDGTRDELLIQALNYVSSSIWEHCEREFTPSTNLTRTFELGTKLSRGSMVGWINLSPYDLRTATAVKLYTDTTPQTLAATEYRLRPAGGALGGTYLDVLTIEPTAAEVWPGFGWEATVQGDWGMAAVPETIKLACADWLKNIVANPGSFASSEMAGFAITPDLDFATTGRGMPRSVMHRLQPFRRRP